MFDNIGEKIKALAKVVCWVGIVASVVMGFASMYSLAIIPALLSFILIGGLGSLGSWVGSFVLYGFGELVANSAIIAGKDFVVTENQFLDTETDNKEYKEEFEEDYNEEENVEQTSGVDILNELLENGIITQNEYDLLVQRETKN